jgi:hypothetical protein
MRLVFCLSVALFLTACDGSQPLLTAPTASPATANPTDSAASGSIFTVFGVVRAGNAPVAGARVAVLEQRDSPAVATDSDGRYSIRASTGQPWGLSPLVAASKPGYFADIRFTEANYAPISKDTQLDFELQPLTYISLGEVVRARVGGANCSHWGYGAGSCARFAVTVLTSGTLEVTVVAAVSDFDIDVVASDGTFAAYDPYPRPSGSPRVRIPVSAGSTYQIRLAGAAPREFELTTAVR